jgi:DNA polymerase-3 subunit beta
MKITVDTATLSRELFKLQGIVSSKSTIPSLSNALLEAKSDGTLSLYASDLDISVASTIPCNVDLPGRLSVRARDLYDAVKNLRADTVTLTKDDNLWVELKAGTVRARLVGMDPDEFPNVQRAVEGPLFAVPARKLIRMIERVLFSVSTDEGRPNLTGAQLTLTDEGTIRMVSTDGHRLSRVELRAGLDASAAPGAFRDGMIVPRKGLSELKRTMDITIEDIELGLVGNSIVFSYGNTTLYVRLIEGTFPNVQGVIPSEDPARKAVIDRKEFQDRLRFVSIFASAKSGSVRLQLDGDTCSITSQDPEKGECEERVEITYSAGVVKAGYNFRYLLDVLGSVDSEQISIEIVDTLSPTILREIDGDDDEDALYVVMPLRI